MKTLARYLWGLIVLSGVSAFAQPVPLVNTSGVLLYPTNFFDANIAWLTNSLNSAGYAPGGGGGSGTVTSVGISVPSSLFYPSGTPVTASGTLTINLTNQTANVVWAGPTTGAAAVPTFRALVDADIPSLIARDSETTAAIAALSTVYQPLDADLTALAAGTAMPTAITNSVSISAPVVNAGSTNVASALAGKQPLNSNLTTLATLDGSALTNLNGSEIRSGTIAIARIASGTPTGSKFVRDDGTLAVPSGSGTGDVLSSGTNTFTGTNTFNGPSIFNGAVALNGSTTVSNLTVSGTLSADNVSYGTPVPVGGGGSGATTALGAQINFGLVPNTNIMAFSQRLQDLAGLSLSANDLLYWTGSTFAKISVGTNNQVLGVSGGVWTPINQTGTGGSSTTNLAQLNDTLISSPSANQALIYNGTKWANTTPASNPLLVNWIGSYGYGTQTNADVATNNVLATFSIPPSASPGAQGRFLQGQVSTVITNADSNSAAFDFKVEVNGTRVIDAVRNMSGNEVDNVGLRIVYESSTTATIFAEGIGPALFISSVTAGKGIYHGTTMRVTSLVATNVSFPWANTNSVTVNIGMRNAGGGSLANIGSLRMSASLYSLQDQSAVVSDTAAAASWDSITNVAPSKNAVYDYHHIGDTDDDGLVDKAKNLTITGQTIQNSLPVSPASSTNIVLDFGFPVLTYSVTNNVNLIQSTNRPAASTNTVFTLLRLAGDTADRTLSWNSNWKRLGTNITIIPSNKVTVISAMVIGSAESGVTFGIAKEE